MLLEAIKYLLEPTADFVELALLCFLPLLIALIEMSTNSWLQESQPLGLPADTTLKEEGDKDGIASPLQAGNPPQVGTTHLAVVEKFFDCPSTDGPAQAGAVVTLSNCMAAILLAKDAKYTWAKLEIGSVVYVAIQSINIEKIIPTITVTAKTFES